MQFWKVTILSYLSSVLLYRWYALMAAWLICLVGWGAIAALPDQYTAQAKVYIDTNNLMDPLLKGLTVSIDPSQEIAVMFRTLITRPTLEQVIHLTSPHANGLTPTQMEEQVAVLRDNISIRLTETKNFYDIGFTANDPVYATSVTQTLLSLLQDSRVGGTRLDMDTVRSFINKQIAEYEQRLRDADKRRADFRTANIEILGKGPASNRIDAADIAHEQAVRELNAALARRDSLKAQIAETSKTMPMDERMFAGAAGTPGVARDETGAVTIANAAQRLQQAQTQLDELRTRYTENYPDVIAAKDLIKRLQAQLASSQANPEARSSNPIMVSNPAYTQLLDKLSNEETNVAALQQRAAAAAGDLNRAKSEATRGIDVTAQFNGLDRDYDNIQSTYKELLQSREAASLSQKRDDQNQGVSFRIVEPPQRPQVPANPNRPVLNSLVLVLGLGGGVSIAVLLSLVAGRILTSEDLVSHFDFPIAGVITLLPGASKTRRNVFSMLAFPASVTLLVISYVGVLSLLQKSIYTVLGV
jgi:polysaccharide chain length determinant protein (PEP-CTERM system associated)